MEHTKHVSKEIQVVIEIPTYGIVKYEIDKNTNMLCVDRFMTSSMQYPTNYGYIPNTLSKDGDSLDALVITPYPIISGAVISCRPIGALKMIDESGTDIKILSVPANRISTIYKNINSYKDLSYEFLSSLKHFFQHYKDLEESKWVKVESFEDIDFACRIIQECIITFNKNRHNI